MAAYGVVFVAESEMSLPSDGLLARWSNDGMGRRGKPRGPGRQPDGATVRFGYRNLWYKILPLAPTIICLASSHHQLHLIQSSIISIPFIPQQRCPIHSLPVKNLKTVNIIQFTNTFRQHTDINHQRQNVLHQGRRSLLPCRHRLLRPRREPPGQAPVRPGLLPVPGL